MGETHCYAAEDSKLEFLCVWLVRGRGPSAPSVRLRNTNPETQCRLRCFSLTHPPAHPPTPTHADPHTRQAPAPPPSTSPSPPASSSTASRAGRSSQSERGWGTSARRFFLPLMESLLQLVVLFLFAFRPVLVGRRCRRSRLGKAADRIAFAAGIRWACFFLTHRASTHPPTYPPSTHTRIPHPYPGSRWLSARTARRRAGLCLRTTRRPSG